VFADLKVLVVSPGLATRLSKIEGLPEDVEFIVPERGTDEELVGLAGDVDVIVATRLSDEVARAARGLRLLQKTGAGVDAMPFDSLGENVYVANTSGANPVPLAEGAVALVLALAKRVVPRHTSFTSGRDPTRGVELRGKKAGIFGLGSIGIEVARRLQAFEMGVLGIRRRPSEELRRELGLEFLGGPGDLDLLLGESDFLVVNVARAAIIQDEPLYRALTEGWIAGAAIDVWWNPHWWDPIWNPSGRPASEFPFWELPNVIATPHNIGSTDSRSDAALRIIAENIRRTARGEEPINQVDKSHRY
jgi:phosphoglycerate dehydrogenase-like enzyme